MLHVSYPWNTTSFLLLLLLLYNDEYFCVYFFHITRIQHRVNLCDNIDICKHRKKAFVLSKIRLRIDVKNHVYVSKVRMQTIHSYEKPQSLIVNTIFIRFVCLVIYYDYDTNPFINTN